MSAFARRLETLHATRPVTVLGAAVIDVIADAYALPWRGCDIELKQQGVNIGGCALNIAIALKRLGIAAQNALPSATACGPILSVTPWRSRICTAPWKRKRAITAGAWRWWSLTVNGPLCRLAAWRTSGSSAGWTG